MEPNRVAPKRAKSRIGLGMRIVVEEEGNNFGRLDSLHLFREVLRKLAEPSKPCAKPLASCT
jgi:hypothetical protein